MSTHAPAARLAAAALTFTVVALMAGCSGGFAPTLPSPQGERDITPGLTPNLLSWEGGPVTITAEVVDTLSGVDSVWALVTPPGASVPTRVNMACVSGDDYSCVYDAPPNPGDAPLVYEVCVCEQDKTGGEHVVPETAPLQFEVGVLPLYLTADVSPDILRYIGGEVTISATIHDPVPLDVVWAVVTEPGGAEVQVPLSPTATPVWVQTLGAGQYSYAGVYSAAYNLGASALQYKVVVHVRNTTPVERASGNMTFQVQAPTRPPDPWDPTVPQALGVWWMEAAGGPSWIDLPSIVGLEYKKLTVNADGTWTNETKDCGQPADVSQGTWEFDGGWYIIKNEADNEIAFGDLVEGKLEVTFMNGEEERYTRTETRNTCPTPQD